MVRTRRLELPPRYRDSDLNAARLPVPPRPLKTLAVNFVVSFDVGGIANRSIRFKKIMKNLEFNKTNSKLINGIQWLINDTPIAYENAIQLMEDRVADIKNNKAPELIWLLEHPPLYTAGTSAKHSDLLDPTRFPVIKTGRGGQYTYHGPGQRVVYVMLDLKRRNPDLKAFIYGLEEWTIQTLRKFNIIGERKHDRVGIWVQNHHPSISASKIASIGIRLRHWITYHGLAINVDPNLEHFSGIVPCGIRDSGVTSLWDMGVTASIPEVDTALFDTFENTLNKYCYSTHSGDIGNGNYLKNIN